MPSTYAHIKRRQARFLAKGLCKWCGRELDPRSKLCCPHHIALRRQQDKRKYDRTLARIEAGENLCPVCAQEKDEYATGAGLSKCSNCHNRNIENTQNYRMRRS